MWVLWDGIEYLKTRPGLLFKLSIISSLTWLGFVGVADKFVDFATWLQIGILQHWRDLQALLIDAIDDLLGWTVPVLLIDYTVIWLAYVRSVFVFRSEFHKSNETLKQERSRAFTEKWDWHPPTPGYMEAAPRKNYGTRTIGVPNPLSDPIAVVFSFFFFPFSLLMNSVLLLASACFSGFMYEVRITYGVVFDATLLFWAQVVLFVPVLFVISDFAHSVGLL